MEGSRKKLKRSTLTAQSRRREARMVSRTLWSRLNKVFGQLAPSLQEGIYVWVLGDPIVVGGSEYTPEEFHRKFPRRRLIIIDEKEEWEEAEKDRERIRLLKFSPESDQ